MAYCRRLAAVLAALTLAALAPLTGTAQESGNAQPAELSAAEQDDVQHFLDHLNGIRTLKARLVQESRGEPTREGTLYLRRPGEMRVEYEDSDTLLVADGEWLIHYDGEFDSASHAPLEETLAGVLARGELALTEDVVITRYQSGDRLARITLKRRSQPEAGALTLFFSREPPRLRQWRITDASGTTTQVSLFDHQYGLELSDELFADPSEGDARF